MTTTYHKEYPADRAAMQAMRSELQLHPVLEFGPGARPVFDGLIAATPPAQNVSYEAATIGGIPGWWCRPSDAVEGVAILYLHGGAYVLGSAGAYRNFAGQIAARAKASTFIADYRLAPEYRFPGAVEDAFAAYQGLSADGYLRLALVGDSAGGGLALSLLLVATASSKGGSVPQPAAAAVISPWTDLALTGDSIKRRSKAEWVRETAKLFVEAGCAKGKLAGLLMHIERSPLFAGVSGNIKLVDGGVDAMNLKYARENQTA